MSAGLLGAWALLVAIQLGWIPFARHAWGFDLWAYLPGWASWVLGAASLPLCSRRVRDALAQGWLATARRVPADPRLEALACAALALALWLVRERVLTGDSAVLVATAHWGPAFIFPEVGVTFLLRGIVGLAPELGLDAVETMRAISCVCGGAAAWLLLRVARELVPGWPAVVVALCVLSGGLARVFAGRIEVYAPLLVAVLLYLWTGLRALRGRGPVALPGLCLGLAIWLHAAAALLLPSLLAIGPLRSGTWRGRDAWRASAGLLVLAGAPLALFAVAHGAIAGTASVLEAWTRVLEILGLRRGAGAVRWWVRGRGGEPSIGTDVVWLSRAHLKYLLNSFALLVPAVLPTLAALLVRRPRTLVSGTRERWLAIAALPLVAYALALRPFWGPWDWDLFALTALLLACVCVRAVAALAPPRGLAVACIGFQLCFVGVPFLWIGAGTPREVGPFGFRGFDYELREPGRPPPERLAPWL